MKVKLSLFIFAVSSVYCRFIAQKRDCNFFLAALLYPYIFSFDSEFDAANITIPRTIPFLVLL